MSAEMSMSRQPSAVDGGSVPSSPTKQRRNLTLFPEEPQQAGKIYDTIAAIKYSRDRTKRA